MSIRCCCTAGPPPTIFGRDIPTGCSVPDFTFFPTLTVGGSIVPPHATGSNQASWTVNPALGTVDWHTPAGFSTPVLAFPGFSTVIYTSHRLSYSLTTSSGADCCNSFPSGTLDYSVADPYTGATTYNTLSATGWYSSQFTLACPTKGSPTCYLFLRCPQGSDPNWELFNVTTSEGLSLGGGFGPFSLGYGGGLGCPSDTLTLV